TITVSAANTPPTVTITNPVNNAMFTPPANVSIQATASDPGGSVTNVQFLVGAAVGSNDTTLPYSAPPHHLPPPTTTPPPSTSLPRSVPHPPRHHPPRVNLPVQPAPPPHEHLHPPHQPSPPCHLDHADQHHPLPPADKCHYSSHRLGQWQRDECPVPRRLGG